MIACIDALNCYNRIAHTMASLVFLAFGVPTLAIEAILKTLENMNFFLRTRFGNSTSFAAGGLSIKTQEMCKGNKQHPQVGWSLAFASSALMAGKVRGKFLYVLNL
jgi:hypothetical protein